MSRFGVTKVNIIMSETNVYNKGMETEFIDRLYVMQLMVDNLLDGHVCAKMSDTQEDIEELQAALYGIYNKAALRFEVVL